MRWKQVKRLICAVNKHSCYIFLLWDAGVWLYFSRYYIVRSIHPFHPPLSHIVISVIILRQIYALIVPCIYVTCFIYMSQMTTLFLHHKCKLCVNLSRIIIKKKSNRICIIINDRNWKSYTIYSGWEDAPRLSIVNPIIYGSDCKRYISISGTVKIIKYIYYVEKNN